MFTSVFYPHKTHKIILYEKMERGSSLDVIISIENKIMEMTKLLKHALKCE